MEWAGLHMLESVVPATPVFPQSAAESRRPPESSIAAFKIGRFFTIRV